MSDRGEHLLGKRTGRQFIHYSVNGGIIQAGGVCIQVCVCVHGRLMLVFFMASGQVEI